MARSKRTRICAGGCGRAVPVGTRSSRCPACRRDAEQLRGTRHDRGYDAAHEREADAWQQRLDRSLDRGWPMFRCWRCGRPLAGPVRGRDWQLGHCDLDRTRYHGPEHPPCNLATAGRTGCPHPSHHPDPHPAPGIPLDAYGVGGTLSADPP